MAFPERYYRWSWTLDAPPDRVWPFVADTNRFNRDAGLPALKAEGTGKNARRQLAFSRFGVRFEWEEEPFEWVRNERFSVRRRYLAGPLASLRVTCTLSPVGTDKSLLVYESWVRPRNILGFLGLPFAMNIVNRRAFGRAFRAYGKAAGRAAIPEIQVLGEPEFAPGGKQRLEAGRDKMLDAGGDPALVARLFDFVATADDMALARVRPYVLADAWGAPRDQLLDLFLWATHFGVFDLQWDFLCPLCGGARETARRLSTLGDRVHCETCNIDLESNLEGAIELTFRVNPAIREALGADFCVAGPEVTPHVVAQQLLANGERRELTIALEPGRYRLRTLGQAGGEFVTVAESGNARGSVTLSEAGLSAGELSLSPRSTIEVDNESGEERLLVLERFDWADQAVTAAAVIARQTFRDLFSRELLRPGQEINISSLTIAFTDLRDSTRIYREIGDASAFSRVLAHFGILQEEITAEGGTVVKTIGDAVMAVFPRPLAGIRALTRSQERLDAGKEDENRFYLKAGLHEGACIAVTLNDHLDYFGNVVNLASRLEKFSTGADVIISEAVRMDPEVNEFLAKGDFTMAEFEAQLKGFDENEFRLWRVGPVS